MLGAADSARADHTPGASSVGRVTHAKRRYAWSNGSAGYGLRKPINSNLPFFTAMSATSLSGARLGLEKSALPVTPEKSVIEKIASLMAFGANDRQGDAGLAHLAHED
ncbi:MAG: hypothetical protein M3145_04505, partial [Pseudomonadota bacterium]|nr:hypothetical protein [Pseudomonadota bacterium]